jgi:hypothetical protein
MTCLISVQLKPFSQRGFISVGKYYLTYNPNFYFGLTVTPLSLPHRRFPPFNLSTQPSRRWVFLSFFLLTFFLFLGITFFKIDDAGDI